MRLSRRACRASPLEVASTRVWRMQSSRRAGSASQVAIMSTRVWRMRRSRWACSASQLFSASISLGNVSDYDFNPRWDCLQEHLRKLPLRGRNLGFAFGLPGPPKRNPFLLGRPLFCRFRRRLASFSMLILSMGRFFEFCPLAFAFRGSFVDRFASILCWCTPWRCTPKCHFSRCTPRFFNAHPLLTP